MNSGTGDTTAQPAAARVKNWLRHLRPPRADVSVPGAADAVALQFAHPSDRVGVGVSAGIALIGVTAAAGVVDLRLAYAVCVVAAAAALHWWIASVQAAGLLRSVPFIGFPSLALTLIVTVDPSPSPWELTAAAAAFAVVYLWGAVLLDEAFKLRGPRRRLRTWSDFAVASTSIVAACLIGIDAVTGIAVTAENLHLYLLMFSGAVLVGAAGCVGAMEARRQWNSVLVVAAAALFPVFGALTFHQLTTQTPGAADPLHLTLFLPWSAFVAAVCHPGSVGIRGWTPDNVPLRGTFAASLIVAALGVGAAASIWGARSLEPALTATGLAVTVAVAARSAISIVDTRDALDEARVARRSAEIVRSEERQHLGKLLHDGVLQQLAALRWTATTATPAELDDRLEAAIAAARAFLHGISEQRPALLQLPAAVEELSRASGGSLEWSTTIHPSATQLTEHSELIWAVVHEAVVNAEKHSGGQHGYVWVGVLRGWCEVRVSDDGTGSAERVAVGAGAGLRQIADILDDHDGRLSVATNAHGTSLIARFSVTARPAVSE